MPKSEIWENIDPEYTHEEGGIGAYNPEEGKKNHIGLVQTLIDLRRRVDRCRAMLGLLETLWNDGLALAGEPR